MQYEDVRRELLRQWPYTGGRADLWVAETGLRYDGGEPVHVVKILQFRGDKVERETLYFAEAFAAPEWRKPWADGGIPERRGDLPATIHGGS